MELPPALRAEIEQAVSVYPVSALAASAQALSARYRGERRPGERFAVRGVEAAAYAASRMPATYCAARTALEAVRACVSEPVVSVLDAGAGTGAASWAVRACWQEARTFTCLEREPAMLALGARLMQADPVLSRTEWVRQDLTAAPSLPAADLVLAAYALNELTPQARTDVLKALWQAAGRLLVLVEPGTPEGFAQLRQARETLNGLGAFLAAPCPHSGPCPLEEGDWCHFTCRVARSRLHKRMKGGDAPYEDEKFSYLAVSRTPAQPAAARILRHPRRDPGRIALRLCGPAGLEERVVTKKQKDWFRLARKAESGGAFPL